MTAEVSGWLKIFIRTTGWNEMKFESKSPWEASFQIMSVDQFTFQDGHYIVILWNKWFVNTTGEKLQALRSLIFSSPDPKGRVRWAIAITWRPSSVVRRKLFQKFSPLKVLDQWKPNLVWIITRVSSFKIVSGDAVHQPTWPLLLKIEHMVKLQHFGNNSKTVNNIKNLTWGKNDQHIKIYLPCNFEVNLITHLGVIALFSSNL